MSSSSPTSTATVPQQQQSTGIESIYSEVRDFYRRYPALTYEPKAQDRTRYYFEQVTKDRPIQKHIDSVYRYKGGSRQQEYVYYQERWTGTDFVGNKIEHIFLDGKVDVPYAHFKWDEGTMSSYPESIEGHNTTYYFQFNEETVKAIEEKLHDGTKYYVTDGDRTYGGFDQQQFTEWQFADLVYYGKTGMRPGTQIVTPGDDVASAQARKQIEEDAKKRKS